MKIPNKLLELSRNELMVACRLYSIVNRHTKLTTNGYAVCIKQETIAATRYHRAFPIIPKTMILSLIHLLHQLIRKSLHLYLKKKHQRLQILQRK